MWTRRRISSSLLCASTALSLCAQLGLSQSSPAYRNTALPFDRRADDLISRMTLDEKVSQLMNDSPAIERLGIPAYNWWNECLHGVARAGRATVFPETIGLAATWDTDLIFRMATVISDEARAKNNDFVRRGKREIYEGLTFWTPNINIFRDPRWGRGMETYGEDPFLTGTLAAQFIRGLQGDDPKYFKTIATAKHYAVHSGPESERHVFDAVVDDRDLMTTYLPQFEMAVKQAHADSVMCAYNRIDGKAACANPRTEQEILRDQWGFKGYVVSDCGAVGDIYLHHKVAGTPEQGVALALKSGTDLNCGVEYGHLVDAVHQGLVAEADVNRALHRLLLARFQLGMFDPPDQVKFAQIPLSENDSPAHRQLALEVARKSIVLLKNDGHALPLSKSLRTVAVIGPDADDPDVLVGNYNGDPSAPVTPLEGIRQKLGSATRVIYARGSDVAAGLPAFETVPASALRVAESGDAKQGLNGEYFNSANFDGRPHKPRELTYPNSGKMTGEPEAKVNPVFTRVDPSVDFNWWDGVPRPGMNDDDFGVRWTGFISAPVTGRYQLGAIGMNAFELYFDGKRIAQFNNIHEHAYASAPVEMEAGKRYPIRLDYHQFLNNADIRLVWAPPAPALESDAISAAQQADAVVLVMGLSPRLEGEEMPVQIEGFKGGDRITLDLPQVQRTLMEKIVALGKPTVLVLMNGSAVAVNWAAEHVPAIVEAWYPGESGGAAIADVLFGDQNPGGRLPVTFYKSAEDLPPFADYKMQGRTYRYFTGQPLYPFGYGLSYTSFQYRNLRLPKRAAGADRVNVSVDIENTGSMAGEEVAQLYIAPEQWTSWPTPIRSLAGFQRVLLQPHQRRTLHFSFSPRDLVVFDENGKRVPVPANIAISVGGGQPGFAGSTTVSAHIQTGR